MRETWVRSLGWEDPLEKKQQPTPVILPGKSHAQRSLAGYSLYLHYLHKFLKHSRGIINVLEWRHFSSFHKNNSLISKILRTFKRYFLICWWTSIGYIKFLCHNRYLSKANSLVSLYKQRVCESLFVWCLVPKDLRTSMLGQSCGLSNRVFYIWKWYQDIDCKKTQLSSQTLEVCSRTPYFSSIT